MSGTAGSRLPRVPQEWTSPENGLLTRPAVHFLGALYERVLSARNPVDVTAKTVTAIDGRVKGLETNDLAQNQEIARLLGDVSSLNNNLMAHKARTVAHGAAGSVVGLSNLADVGKKGVVSKMPEQADTAAATTVALAADFNALLAKMRGAGLLSPTSTTP